MANTLSLRLDYPPPFCCTQQWRQRVRFAWMDHSTWADHAPEELMYLLHRAVVERFIHQWIRRYRVLKAWHKQYSIRTDRILPPQIMELEHVVEFVAACL